MSKEKYDESIYYTLGSEIATLMEIKNKIVEHNTTLKELKYSDNDITCHICLHHKYGYSYVPVIEVKKDYVFINITKEKALYLNQLENQLRKVKVLNAIAKLKLSIIEEVEELLKEEHCEVENEQ